VVPTTSRPPRRSKGRHGATQQGSPLKGIRLDITLIGAARGELERSAAEKGLAVEEKGGDLSVTFAAATPEEALAQIKLLSGLLARKT
jgi:hypothetical protein